MIKKIQPYLYLGRFHSLEGALLLLLPSYWSIALNSKDFSNTILLIYYYIIFLLGAVFMRAIGCVINDMADKKIDAQITRTKHRPLAAKTLNTKQAIYFILLMLIIPTLIFLTLNSFAKIIALSSLVFVILYPFSKRYFKAPQFILGLTFNWGILLADAVLNQTIHTTTIILYVAAIFWTLAYDTIYAYQDYKDDKKIGIKSLAVWLGDKPKPYILTFYIIMLYLVYTVASFKSFSSYFNILFVSASFYILYNLYKLNYKDTKQCFNFFKQNCYFAIILWLAFLGG